MRSVIGVDVGGSGIRAATLEDGRLGELISRPVVDRSPGAVLAGIEALIEALGPRSAVGVAVPGFVDGQIVRASPNFPAWLELNLGGALSARLGCPVVVENDANAAALGWAAQHGARDVVLLTLGTGVGGGVVSAGALLRGARGTGAELGHIFVGGERRCGCGARGCLETHVGAAGLAARAAELGLVVEGGKGVIEAAQAGDRVGFAVIEEAGAALGRGLGTLVNLFNPSQVVLSGGLTAGRALLEPAMLGALAASGIAVNVAEARLVWEGRAEGLAIAGVGASALAALDAPSGRRT